MFGQLIGMLLVATAVSAAFRSLSADEVRKQEDIRRDIDRGWDNFRDSAKNARLEKLDELAGVVDRRIASYKKEIAFARKHLEGLGKFLRASSRVFTPAAFRSVRNARDLLEATIDELLATLSYMHKYKSRIAANRERVLGNPDAEVKELDMDRPVLVVRGQCLCFNKTELCDKKVRFDGQDFEIGDWEDRGQYLSGPDQVEVPLFVDSFEPGTMLGRLSFAKGSIRTGLDAGKKSFRCRITSNSEYPIRAAYGSADCFKILNRGLKDPKNRPPRVNEQRTLFVWDSDRHLDNVIAGEYPAADCHGDSLISLPLKLSKQDARSLGLAFGRPGTISVFSDFVEGSCFFGNGACLAKIEIGKNCVSVIEVTKPEAHTIDPLRYTTLDVVPVRFREDCPEHLAQMLSFLNKYKKLTRQSDLYRAQPEMLKKISFYCRAFEVLKRQFQTRSCQPVPISGYVAEPQKNGLRLLKEVRSPDLWRNLYALREKASIGADAPSMFNLALKINNKVFTVTRTEGDSILLQSQLLDPDEVIDEGLLFLSQIPGFKGVEDALDRFRKGAVRSAELQKAILFPDSCPALRSRAGQEAPARFIIRSETEDGLESEELSSQAKAFLGALSTPDIYLVQGPPGTGKTTVIKEIVKAWLSLHSIGRVLVSSQSHVAVDNVLISLIEDPAIAKLCVRLGSERVAEKIDKRVKALHREREIPASARIIGITLGSIPALGYEMLGPVDLSIIDEAGKASLPETLPGIINARKLILVGDHKQLPPMVEELSDGQLSQIDSARAQLWESSLFEQLMYDLPASRKTFLNTQYRMADPIGDLVSRLFYEGMLQNGPGTQASDPGTCLSWHECRLGKELRSPDRSRYNPYEAERIKDFILHELPRTAQRDGIGSVVVLSPYASQVRLLNKILFPWYRYLNSRFAFSVSTIDAYQGQEADLVIYSTVRREGNTSFLKDTRRLNVVLSRAKRRFILFGCSDLLCASHEGESDLYTEVFRHPLTNLVNYDREDEEITFSEMMTLFKLRVREQYMKKNLLMLTTGSRDIMKIVRHGQDLYKTRFDSSSLGELPFESCIDVPDLPRKLEAGIEVAYGTPLLEKAIFAMIRLYNARPDAIMLISTDRSTLLEPLEKILLHLGNKGYKAATQLCEFLIRKIQDDPSTGIAHKILEKLAEPEFRTSIGLDRLPELILLSIGSKYLPFNRISLKEVKKLDNEFEILELLSICDINREGFMAPAVYETLEPVLGKFRDHNIHCAFTGGLPITAHNLSLGLDQLLPASGRNILQIPEDISGLNIDPLAGLYHRYFSLARALEEALIKLDPDLAAQIYRTLVATLGLRPDNKLRLALDPLMTNFSWSQCGDAFELNLLRLISSMYQGNYTMACYWLNVLLLVSVKLIIRSLEDSPFSINEHDMILLTDGKESKYIHDPLQLFNRTDQWKNSARLIEFRQLLGLSTSQSSYWELKKIADGITSSKPYPQIGDPRGLLIELLAIDPDTIQNQFVNIHYLDWNELIRQEEVLFGEDCLLNKLFKLLAGNRHLLFKPVLRESAARILETLRGLSTKLGIEDMLSN